MARAKNVVEKAESMIGKIPNEYQMSIGQIEELYNAFSGNCFSLIVNSFRFGYIQGMKAAKAQMRRNKGE